MEIRGEAPRINVVSFGARAVAGFDSAPFVRIAKAWRDDHSGGVLYFPPGRFTFASNTTLDGPLELADGAVLVPDAGVTITFSGSGELVDEQYFDTTRGGFISFAGTLRKEIRTTWFGNDNDPVAVAAAVLAAATANLTFYSPSSVLPIGNVYRHGAIGDGVANDLPALAAANSSGKPVHIPSGTFRLSSSLTLSADLVVDAGALLRPDAGVTITISGRVNGGSSQWIDSAAPGNVVFAPSSQTEIRAEWFGVKGDWDFFAQTGTDNSAAFAKLDASLSGDITVGTLIRFPVGGFRTTAGMRFQRHGTRVVGAGKDATRIVFDPATDGQVLFEWRRDDMNGDGLGDELFGGGGGGFTVYSTNANDRAKTALKFVDVSEVTMEQFAVHNTFSSKGRKATNPSIGIHTQGREVFRAEKGTIFTDRPVWIDSNPNWNAGTPIDLRIDSDTFHFTDMYLGALEITEAIFLLGNGLTGLNLQNLVIDGSSTWVGPGKHFIKYIVPAGQAWHANRSIRIANLRSEGMGADDGWFINIDLGGTDVLQGLVVENCQPGATNGVRLRGVYDAQIDVLEYSGIAANPRTVLDVDTSCNRIYGRNVTILAHANNGISLGGLRKAYAFGSLASNAIESEFYLVRSTEHPFMKIVGDDPDNGSAAIEITNVNGRTYRVVSGIPGASNVGFTIRDMNTNKNIIQMDSLGILTVGGVWVELTDVGGTFIAKSADGTRYKLTPPNGGGAAAWVLA